MCARPNFNVSATAGKHFNLHVGDPCPNSCLVNRYIIFQCRYRRINARCRRRLGRNFSLSCRGGVNFALLFSKHNVSFFLPLPMLAPFNTVLSFTQRRHRQLRKAYLIEPVLTRIIKNKGSGKLVVGSLDEPFKLIFGKVFSRNVSDRCVIKIKYCYNVPFSDDLVVSDVKIHFYDRTFL